MQIPRHGLCSLSLIGICIEFGDKVYVEFDSIIDLMKLCVSEVGWGEYMHSGLLPAFQGQSKVGYSL